MRSPFKLVVLALGLAAPVQAADVALVIGNRTHLVQPALPEAAQVRDAIEALRAAGFTVLSGKNQTADAMNGLAARFRDAAGAADHLVIVLAGHLASSPRDGWLLGADAALVDGFTVGGQGLSLGGLMDIAAAHPGAALVAIGQSGTAPQLGSDLSAGPGDMNVPQGVTLVQGPTAGVMRFLSRGALVPGQSLGAALATAPTGVTGRGFVSRTVAFLPPGQSPASDQGTTGMDADTAYWQAVQSIGTLEALQTYPVRFPHGRYLSEANRMITDLRAAPERRARAAEDALKLNREARRQIQRNLSILGFNPRGIDGIFGRGTRAAISAFQGRNGFDETGYLSGNQISVLKSRAEARARKLEEEARLRQEEQDRQDAAWWRNSGRDGTEAGLRDYLERYPDGLYSQVARERLQAIEARKRQDAEVQERTDWDAAESVGTAQAYRQFLAAYPNSAFADLARDRLNALQEDESSKAEREQAQAQESRVTGNPVMRLLVEDRLKSLGLKPGGVDGTFDDDTRRAIRKFQKTRKIPVTGYVTQQTLVQLLAGQ